MQPIYANHTVSISELKKNPTQLINQAAGKPVAILNHNIATAYLIPAITFEKILDALDDHQLETIVKNRLSDHKKAIRIKSLDDL